MHDQTTHGMLLPLSDIHDSVCNVHLNARLTMHGTLLPLSDIHDFMRSVHLDARPDHAQNVI